MTTSQFRASFKSYIHLFGLTALTWTTFVLAVSCDPGLHDGFPLLFAFGAGLWSVFILRGLGYLEYPRFLPRRSDLLVVMVAMPLGGGLQHLLIHSFFNVSICSLKEVLVWAPALALVIFGSHYLLTWYLLRRRSVIRVVLDVLPSEKLATVADFRSVTLRDRLRFLNLAEMGEYLESGREREIDLIVISRAAVRCFDEDALLIRAHLHGVPIVDRRLISSSLTGRIRLLDSDMWTYILAATPQTPLLRLYSYAKYFLEPVMALILIFLLMPLIALTALAIRLTSTGPIFYHQLRTGYQGRNFWLIKFRSMVENAETNGPRWAASQDTRITPVGRFIRKTRLDELPQLWNVMRGEMSFFGPRPERPEIYDQLKVHIPLFNLRTVVRPGISGWAQVCGGYANTIEESKTKLEYDLYYIQHMSPRLDFVVFARTLKVLFFGKEFIVPRPAQRMST